MRVVVGLLIFAGACALAAFILHLIGKRDKARRKAELEKLLAAAHAESGSVKIVPNTVPTSQREPRYATGALLSPEAETAHRERRAALLREQGRVR